MDASCRTSEDMRTRSSSPTVACNIHSMCRIGSILEATSWIVFCHWALITPMRAPPDTHIKTYVREHQGNCCPTRGPMRKNAEKALRAFKGWLLGMFNCRLAIWVRAAGVTCSVPPACCGMCCCVVLKEAIAQDPLQLLAAWNTAADCTPTACCQR